MCHSSWNWIAHDRLANWRTCIRNIRHWLVHNYYAKWEVLVLEVIQAMELSHSKYVQRKKAKLEEANKKKMEEQEKAEEEAREKARIKKAQRRRTALKFLGRDLSVQVDQDLQLRSKMLSSGSL